MVNNNDLSNSENILVKVDQNNLMYIDPNSVISNGEILPRSVNQEKLAMFVNLEADIVPRSILVAGNDTSTLQQIAKGTLNFLSSQKKGDRDFSTSWTDAYVEKPRENSGTDKIKDDYEQSDGTGESFGIESITITVKGGNFIPQVNINFIDVRGKTLFESAENSPYKAFFHIPWPIFYLTVKGYYGKAIRYRLHLVKFNSRFNDSNGNFEVQTTFVGSTYAFMNDIPLKGIINAPYMFMKESTETIRFNEQTGRNELKVTKSSKGYQILKSVYTEMKAKKLIPQDFPVKTIKEIGVIAKSLDKLLEKIIFDEVIDTKVLSGLKDFETNLNDFERAIKGWGNTNLSKTNFETINDEIFYSYKENIKDKKSLEPITGTTNGSLNLLITQYNTKLKSSALFNKELQKKDKKGVEYNFRIKQVGETSDYYRTNGNIKNNVIVAIDKLVSDIQEIKKIFDEQRTIIERAVEKRMNEVVKDKTKGIGFEPTVRNIFAVLLANAEVYVRLMKQVHQEAFNVALERKNRIKNFDKETLGDSIFPWPEIKKTDPGTKKRVIAYPGEPELRSQLKSFNRVLWPEVSFVEEYLSISTNRTDPIAENGVNDLDYIFESNLSESQINQISTFFETNDTIPYYDRSISSVLYEIYERAKQITLIDSFTTKTLTELADIEFKTLKEILGEEIDIVGVLSNNIKSKSDLEELMFSFSPFERHPYYTDSIPTVEYIKNIVDSPFKIEQYDKDITNSKNVDETLYSNLSSELKTYEPENYRKNIYPFNSSTYLSYLNVSEFTDNEFKFNGNLTIDTKNGFICSPISTKSWVKENYRKNLFTNKLNIGETYVNILNTPYFHKQLYTDFFKDNSYAKYVGTAYLFLNSLPFHDLEDKIIFTGVEVDSTSGSLKSKTLPEIRMSSLFREVASTSFVPYHLLLKWGSLYHRYKEYVLNNNDILTGFTTSNITQPIDGNLFFNNNQTGSTFTAFTVNTETVLYSGDTGDLGIHPYYDAIYHQFLNDYNHYVISSGNTSYSSNVSLGAIRSRSRLQQNNLKYWTNFVDNSIFDTNDKRYTILPSDGNNKNINREVIAGIEVINGDSFSKGTQSNFRCIWEDDYINDGFSGKTFPSYGDYNKSYVTGTTTQRLQYDNKYSISDDYRKIIDLISTFSPKLLEQFEDMFLQFATERLNEEIPYKRFEKVKHDNFQNIMKEILTVEKLQSDPSGLTSSDTTILINNIKDRQVSKLEKVTNDILSVNNLIKITLSNPKEIDSYTLDGFVQKSGNTLTFNTYNISQTGNTKYITLYVGEDIDGYYLDFFQDMNIELSENNVLSLRQLILIYAGYLKSGGVANRSSFKTYLNDNILNSTTANPKLGADNRLSFYLTQLTQKFSQLKIKEENNLINFVDGFNNRILKVELYNFFKSFNDKWSAGNSIGQRLLLEEFLFLDKANKDIGDKAFLNLTRFLSILNDKNDKANLYSTISMLIQGTGFDLRPLPAYVNFYGTNITTKGKITPSKRVAENLFGTFLEVDYEESSPKMIIQFTGPQSRHPSDMNTKYKFKDDSFNVANVNDNPLIVTLPDVFDVENLNKSNKVVAFEVSFGDQYQSIFKGLQLDQSSLRNTSESFVVLENLARSESGAGAYNVDIGLFDYYRQASYTCEVTAMGNVMIQPTMYFYLKNVPMFRGTYWITEVSHSIRNNNIVTNFKGSRVPIASLPDPEDSFVSSYRPLFDKIMNAANILQTSQNTTTTEKIISTDKGNFVIDPSGITINGETEYKGTPLVGINEFGVPYNGYGNEKYIQRVSYKEKSYFRAIVARMGSEKYPISDDTSMSLVSRLKNYVVKDSNGNSGLKWSELKAFNDSMKFYSLKFQLSDIITADKASTAITTFLNPNNGDKQLRISPAYYLNRQSQALSVQGPVNIGPNINGYGIGMSNALMSALGVHEGEVIYFNFE